MPVYQIMGRNGKLYEIEGPPGVTKDQIKAKILARAPEAGLPPQEKSAIEDIPVVGGALSSIADIPLSAVQGLAGTGKTVSDLFGADNAVSDVLGGIAEGAGRLKSAGSKEDAAISAAEQKSAEDKGILEQIQAAGRTFGRAPLETTASVVGSAVPFIVASVTGGIPAAAALGAASGVGMIKGAIYDAVVEEFTKAGASPEQAQAAAEKAQEYSGENLDQQALGGVLGALAAATGFGPAIARRLGSQAAARAATQAAARQAAGKAAPGLVRRGATGAVTEAIPEAVQAGQERAAQNIALQREGFDVDTSKGVAGQAAFEGIASLIPGIAGGVVSTRTAPTAPAAPAAEEETSELDIPITTGVDPEVTLARLSEAAGPDISPAARIAVEALNRRVSNDLSLSTAESLDASRAFITAREDDIESGTFPEDIAGPYANALAEAKRMLEEVVPATTQATADAEAAQTQAEPGGVAADILAPIKAAPNMVERKKVARPLVSNIVDELVGDVVVPSKVLTDITTVVSQEAAKPDAQFDLKARVGELLTKNGVEVVAAEPAPEVAVEPAPIGFKTAMGSTYTLDTEGRTTRDKAKRDAPGHEADFGRKPTSAKTVYVDSAEQAASLSAAGLSGLGEKGARVVIKDGKATLLTWNGKENRWGTTPSSRDIPVYSEPAVGRAPLELWKPAKDVPGNEAYRGMHAGNLITELVTPAAPIAAEPAPEPTPAPAPPEKPLSFEEYLAAARASELAPTPTSAPSYVADNARATVDVLRQRNPAVLDTVTDLHAQDKTAAEIAAATKLDVDTIRDVRIGLGLPSQGKPSGGKTIYIPGDAEERAAFEAWRDQYNIDRMAATAPTPAPAPAPTPTQAAPTGLPKIAQSLQPGDVVRTEFGDTITISKNIPSRTGGEVLIIGTWNSGEEQVFKASELDVSFMPQPYVDSNTGERKMGEAWTVERDTPAPVAVEPAPEPVAVEPAPEPVAVEPVPPVPPVPPTPPPTGGEPSAAIPEPTLPPQRAELQTPNKWLVKLADRFGMSAPLDAFVKANLGYESLPEALETTSKLELSTSRQAGKVRNLQRNFFNPIVDQTANLKADLADLGFFLWARGAADRNRVVAEINPQEFPEGGSGLTTAQAAAGLQLLKDEGKLPKLNQLARKVDKLVDFNLEEDIEAGLLSREQAKQLREAQPFYVPLKGFAKDGDMLTADIDEDADTVSRQQEAMRSLQTTMPTGSVREFRTAYGRGDVPFHPLFNLFQDSESRVRRRVVNTALLPILRAYKQNPAAFEGILNVYSAANPKQVKMGRDIPGGRWEPVPNMEQEYYRNRDKYMMVKENGVPHYIEFAEQGSGAEIKRMFANMKSEDLKGAMQTAADINNFMKGMLTFKNPLYLLFVAPFRDTSAAIATALANQNIKTSPAYKKNLVGNTILQIANPTTALSIVRYVFGKAPMTTPAGKLLEEMIDAGGAPLQARFLNVQEKTNIAARAIKTMRGIESLSPKERAANLLAGLNRWIDGLADIMDLNARFATYRAAIGLGIKPRDAARLALDSSLNLTRRGEMARSLDIALPFFGAGVEGGRKTARILTNPKALTKVFGSMIVLGVLESLWNAGQSGDDDEDGQENYLDQDRANLRMNRLIIYHGSGADDYFKVPIDPMLGYFKFVGNRIGDVMVGTASPSEAATGLVPGFISLMSPLRVPGTDVQSLAVAATPLMGKPFVENIMNQNFFGSPIYKERTFDNAPRSELGRETTGDFWKGLAKVINAAGGGSEAVSSPYGADFQPEVYRHIIESYFGGPYQLAKQMAGLKEAEGIADVPGIKSFVGSGSEYAPQSKYFENTTTVRQIMNRLSKLTPEQQARQGEKYFEDTDPRIMDAFKAVEANLDRINKEQKASMALAKSDEDRQVVLDYYRKQKNQYYSAFNYTYNATKRGE